MSSKKKKKSGSKQHSGNSQNRNKYPSGAGGQKPDEVVYYDDFGQEGEDVSGEYDGEQYAGEEYAEEQYAEAYEADEAVYAEDAEEYGEAEEEYSEDAGEDYEDGADEPDFDRSDDDPDHEDVPLPEDEYDTAVSGSAAGAGAASESEESWMPEFLRPFAEKCGVFFDDLDKRLYRMYFKPDRSTLVSQKTTIISLAVAAGISLLLGFAVIIFLGTYPYYTTGMKTKDFIREFNNITSDTDIRTIVPSFTDVTIPEKAKLGREPVYLADGHVKLTAETRFGRIIRLDVEGIDIPNYDEQHYEFITEYNPDYDPANEQFYYYIALGKTAIAAQKLITPNEDDLKSSDSDTSASDEYDLSYVPTIYEAASYGYQLYYYSYYYYANRLNSGYLYLPIGKSYLYYELSEAKMTIKPVIEKVTNLPEGLQKFWDGFTGKNKKDAQLVSDSEVVGG